MSSTFFRILRFFEGYLEGSSMNGFHAFLNKEKVFSEIKRVLKNDGIFIGCFYTKGIKKRIDWFIKNIYVKSKVDHLF